MKQIRTLKKMKKCGMLAILLWFLMFLPLSSRAQMNMYTVSKEEAFTIVKKQFDGKKCDYFWIKDSSEIQIESSKWYFFVDPSPGQMWNHDSYVVMVPTTGITGYTPTITKTLRSYPPQGDMEVLEMYNPYGARKNDTPRIPIKTTTTGTQDAGKTHAIIISGGIDLISNKVRYWNDCSFIYQVLRYKYQIPKEDIYLLMSDGKNSDKDMLDSDGNAISSPLDLDFDGVNDLEMAATRKNIKQVFTTLESKVKEGDHVFLYVIDHGANSDSNPKVSYIWLWNREIFYDYELAKYVKPLLEKGVFFNTILGQCMSGGFLENLAMAGCVVTTASDNNSESYACKDIPYDEFVYWWTSALYGETPYGEKVNADVNGDGHLTMEEVFETASSLDSQPDTPLYLSTPLSIGEDLSFDRQPMAVDLYIMDNLFDTGKTPNLSTDRLWDSPSIWIRNEDDNGIIHQTPYYSDDHKTAYINVTVSNRGKNDYTGGKSLRLYWAKASTGMNDNVWMGTDSYAGSKTGGAIGRVSIDTIPSGASKTFKVKWNLPSALADMDESLSSHQYTILAMVYDASEYSENLLFGTAFDPKINNNVACKSTTVLFAKNENITVKSYFRNLTSTANAYTLRLIPRTNVEAQLMINQQIHIDISSNIYNGWITGGRNMYGMTTNASTAPRKFIPYKSNAYLSNIKLASGVTGEIAIGAKFPTSSLTTSKTYTFDLIQQTTAGEIIGGETIVIKSPGISPLAINVLVEEYDDGSVNLSVDDENAYKAVWLCEDEEIGTGESVTVRIREREQTYQVLIPRDEDMIALGSITVAPGLRNLHVSEDCKSLDALFDTAINLESLSYVIIKMDDFCQTNECPGIAMKNDTLRINLESLSPGMYQISFLQTGIPVGSAKFRKLD